MNIESMKELCLRFNISKLVTLDVETTGLSIPEDSILQISLIGVGAGFENGSYSFDTLVDPGVPFMPNPIHNITVETVFGKPKFRDLIPTLVSVLEDSVIVGFNSDEFDIPMLREEFARCNEYFPRYIGSLDACTVYKKFNPRNLTSAVKDYLGEEHTGAHDSWHDTVATAKVFNKQLTQHGLMFNDGQQITLPELIAKCSYNQYCDAGKKFKRTPEGDFVFTEGLLNGMSVFNPLAISYLKSYIATSMSQDTKMISRFFLDTGYSLHGQS